MLEKQRFQATGKYIRVSPHKTRRILDQIRGKEYSEALLMLEFMPHKPSRIIQKVIKSALNNKTNVHNQTVIIKKAIANNGPKLKRFQPRAQGRAFPIHKPTCHITIELEI